MTSNICPVSRMLIMNALCEGKFVKMLVQKANSDWRFDDSTFIWQPEEGIVVIALTSYEVTDIKVYHKGTEWSYQIDHQYTAPNYGMKDAGASTPPEQEVIDVDGAKISMPKSGSLERLFEWNLDEDGDQITLSAVHIGSDRLKQRIEDTGETLEQAIKSMKRMSTIEVDFGSLSLINWEFTCIQIPVFASALIQRKGEGYCINCDHMLDYFKVDTVILGGEEKVQITIGEEHNDTFRILITIECADCLARALLYIGCKMPSYNAILTEIENDIVK